MTTFGLFVKHPVAGRVKTRLAEDLGPELAAEAYAAFVADLVERFRRTGERRVLCYTPAGQEAEQYFQSRAQSDYLLWLQPGVDLGERMARFFREHLRQPADRVVLIGSDSPTLPREYVEQAFALLQTADCVLGPATDGGYYLIGQRGVCRPIFEDISWSTSEVLAQTICRITAAGASLSLLPPWYDVDAVAGWNLLRGHVAGLVQAGAEINLDAVRRVLSLDTVTNPRTL